MDRALPGTRLDLRVEEKCVAGAARSGSNHRTPKRTPGDDDPSSFPIDILPPLWRDWCRRNAGAASAPADYVALSLLTMAAGLIGGGRRIAPAPAWREPCVLWTALAGAPGSGRTRGMDAALSLVRELEHRLGTTGDAAYGRYAGAREAARVHARLWRQDVRNMVIAGEAPDPLPREAMDPPPPRRLVMDDPRIQHIADAGRGNPQGMLLAPGTLDGWLAARRRAGPDQRCWLKAWSAQPWTFGRPGAPVTDITCAVSILGTLRPEAIPRMRPGDDDDVLARFLFAGPQRPAVQPLSLAADGLCPAALDALARLRDMPPAVRDVPLAPEALALFEAFRHAHDAEAAALDGREAAWWDNGPALVLRLAGVLCFLDWAARAAGTPEPALVSARDIGAAIDLWQVCLWPQARAVFDTLGRRDMERVQRWLAAQRLTEVSREQIRRDALSQAVDAAQADAVAEKLVAAGWLRPVGRTTTGPGRPARRWHVDPGLSEASDPDARRPCSHLPCQSAPGRESAISNTRFESATRDIAPPVILSEAKDPAVVVATTDAAGDHRHSQTLAEPPQGPSLRSGRQSPAAISATRSESETRDIAPPVILSGAKDPAMVVTTTDAADDQQCRQALGAPLQGPWLRSGRQDHEISATWFEFLTPVTEDMHAALAASADHGRRQLRLARLVHLGPG
ncbi:DUF3987 domain-containing protein, partial [Vineibacter terrae]|uniref:DUF3987 domain-containing protein n=1 Tax=Vineibacter terrae TaxID=2586908 RepID=UPI002E350CD1